MVSVREETAPKAPIIRRAQPADAEVCGRICYEAFTKLNNEFNFPPDFPSPEVAQGVLASMFGNPGFFCVVAEQDGRILGSNCMDERCAIAGIGPITVDPAAQNKTVGRQLMMAVMDRAAERRFAGVRLVQAAFHSRSMALYAKLGFDIREPLVVMQGPAIREVPSRICGASRCCRRCAGLQRPLPARSWPRPLRRIGRRYCGWTGAGGRARRKDHGVCIACWIFWTHCGREQCGVAGASRGCGCIRRAGNSGSDAQHRTLSLVPESGSARRRADDTDDRGLVQRACWRIPAFDLVLSIAGPRVVGQVSWIVRSCCKNRSHDAIRE